MLGRGVKKDPKQHLNTVVKGNETDGQSPEMDSNVIYTAFAFFAAALVRFLLCETLYSPAAAEL